MRDEQPTKTDVLAKGRAKGRAVLSAQFSYAALDKAVKRAQQSQAQLRSLGITPEKTLVNEVVGMLELSQTLDAINPGLINPDTYEAFLEALVRLGGSVARAQAVLTAADLVKGES